MHTLLIIAVQPAKHPKNKEDYKVWYLELCSQKEVVGLGALSKTELIDCVFKNYRAHGKSCFRVFPKGSEKSQPIELIDFLSMSPNENTHFGELPTISEFQGVLDQLKVNLELRSIA
ncbi:MAG: hypothetical protein HOE90_20455 [Bacteriovoracaceae bacterium]|jgi:hypothetical protein|nr:hypothetical protein [Bacteriovoracaceae bacterium]